MDTIIDLSDYATRNADEDTYLYDDTMVATRYYRRLQAFDYNIPNHVLDAQRALDGVFDRHNPNQDGRCQLGSRPEERVRDSLGLLTGRYEGGPNWRARRPPTEIHDGRVGRAKHSQRPLRRAARWL